MTHARRFALGGIAAALLVPAVAVAVDVPSVFQSGQPLSSAALNGNFNAIKQAVDQLEAEVATVQARAASAIVGCQWLYTSCNSGPGVECTAICPANTHPVSGACDATAGGDIAESRPSAGTATFPPSPSPASQYDRWICESSTGNIQNTYVLCCDAP